MEYQIEDAERSGAWQVVVWVCKWPDYKVRFQASVKGLG
jgi:hypothetical protein